jgi:Copper type II ascorbate-dependent monooxygenase, C-terminal domain
MGGGRFQRNRETHLLAVALATAAAVLAGCGSSGSTSHPANHANQANQGAAAPSERPAAARPAEPAAPPAVPLRAGERHTTVWLPAEYRPAAPSGGTDDYRCFVIDPQLDTPTFVTGAEVLPGNPKLVHHAILYRVEPGQADAVAAADAATPDAGWTCFGGAGLPTGDGGSAGQLDAAPWVTAWAPGGGGERLTGRGTGVLLKPGSQLVLQMHYNLLHGSGVDRSGVRLRLAAGGAKLQPLHTILLPAPVELPCAPAESGPLCERDAAVADVSHRFGTSAEQTIAGLQFICQGDLAAPRSGQTQSCDRRINEPATIRAVAGHMHLLGRSITIELNPGTPAARTLLDIKTWNFDDQGAVPLRQPVRVTPGDQLRVTCRHDASLRSKLPALRDQQPRYVVWGEGTSDEMCLGIVVVTRP